MEVDQEKKNRHFFILWFSSLKSSTVFLDSLFRDFSLFLSWGRFANSLSYSSCFLQQTSDNTVQTLLRRPSASSLSE